MNKGNVEKVLNDKNKIAQRLRNTDVTIRNLMKEYHCGHGTLVTAIRAVVQPKELKQIIHLRITKGGSESRFTKGHATWNKNAKNLHLSPKTEFKKGHLPDNHKHVGMIVVRNVDGKQFRWIKIAGLLNGRHKWIPYARYIWELKNGPVPKGFFVGHLDGDTMNDNTENHYLADRRKHLALMKQLNPNWKKKAIKKYKKTAAKKRRIRERDKKRLELSAKSILRDRRLDERDKRLVTEYQKTNGMILQWQCCMCGENFKGNQPEICPKCNGISFEQLNLPIRQITKELLYAQY